MDAADIASLNAWLVAQGSPGRIGVRAVAIEHDLFQRLPGLLSPLGAADRPVLVVMDHTPMRRGHDDAKQEFLQHLRRISRPEVIRLGTPSRPPHADLSLAEDLSRHLPPRCLLMSFGSGTVTDLAKHARFLADRQTAEQDRRTFITVPTACTVTAFSSALAVLGVAGVKRTIPSQSPDYAWIDLATLADAPPELTRAGVGDLLARGIAYADWYLSSLLGIDESYTDVPRLLLADHEARLPRIAADLAAGRTDAFGTLMEALLLAGYAMSVVGQTTPISGWEHVMSHYLDLWNSALHKPLNLHGVQVAAGTFVATRAYQDFLRHAGSADLLAAGEVDLAALARTQIQEHFTSVDPSGALHEELLRDYLPKAQRWRTGAARLKELAALWPCGCVQQELSARLMPLEKLDAIATALALPRSLSALDSLPSASTPADAVRYGHLVRRRFTLGDLLSALGWLDGRRIRSWLEDEEVARNPRGR